MNRGRSQPPELWENMARLDKANLEPIIHEFESIRACLAAESARLAARLDQVHANHQASARNLVHYLALRHRDLRPLQLRLATLGLPSLGRAESHVLATVDSILDILYRLSGCPRAPTAEEPAAISLGAGEQLLADHTEALLGPATAGRGVRIMVTMPSEAADDGALIRDLIQGGMDCMRINCAHDNADVWARMIEHLRQAEQELGRPCHLVMDLAGPKLRTGPLEPGPAVVKLRPRRDALGRVTAAARVWLTPNEAPTKPPAPADGCLHLPKVWLAHLQQGERLTFNDARGSKREFVVEEVTASGCWVETTKTAYIVPGTVLRQAGKGKEHDGLVGGVPATENAILLEQGDRLMLMRSLAPGQVTSPAMIGCSIPEVLDSIRVGASIWFDDGRIGGVIEQVEAEQVQIRITQVRQGGRKLRTGKGINLPESRLKLPALTTKDLDDLPFLANHADAVELSFVNGAADVELLQKHLKRLGGRAPAIVLKIETRRGFDNLPELLLTAMKWPCFGVMIARGDLAVECGFERLAEVQEEILWICEAAHVPVIWATQVLESLAKEGMASRAEITDAAMGDRAECVMLNKGPHVLSAVGALDNILRRMQTHQAKKRAKLRTLRLCRMLPSEPDTGLP